MSKGLGRRANRKFARTSGGGSSWIATDYSGKSPSPYGGQRRPGNQSSPDAGVGI